MAYYSHPSSTVSPPTCNTRRKYPSTFWTLPSKLTDTFFSISQAIWWSCHFIQLVPYGPIQVIVEDSSAFPKRPSLALKAQWILILISSPYSLPHSTTDPFDHHKLFFLPKFHLSCLLKVASLSSYHSTFRLIIDVWMQWSFIAFVMLILLSFRSSCISRINFCPRSRHKSLWIYLSLDVFSSFSCDHYKLQNCKIHFFR